MPFHASNRHHVYRAIGKFFNQWSCILSALTLASAATWSHAAPPNAFGRSSVNGDPANIQYTPSDWKIFRLIGPPLSNSTDFATSFIQGPITDAVSRPESIPMYTSTDTQVGRWEFLWGDRNTMDGWGKVPNDPSGLLYIDPNASTTPVDTRIQCRTAFYDTATGAAHDPDKGYRYAIGSTLVRAAYSAGFKFLDDVRHPEGKGWGQIAEAYGYDVSYWRAKWNANPNDPIFTEDLAVDSGDIVHRAYCEDPENIASFFWQKVFVGGKNYYTSVNRIVLPPRRLADINVTPAGVYLDHEHQDERSPELELEYLTELAKILHCLGMQLHVSSEPPYHGNIGHNMGITSANAWAILNVVDSFVMIVGDNFPVSAMQTQYDFWLGPSGEQPAPKLTMQLIPGQLDTNEATAIRNFMILNEIDRIFMPAGPGGPFQYGGPLSDHENQFIATVLGLPTSIAAPSSAPTGLVVTSVANQPLSLTWNAASHATSYKVKRATSSSGPYIEVAEVVGATSYADRGLAPSTTYYYVVSSANFGGQGANSAPNNAVTSSTLVPDVPIGLILTAGAGQMSLTWTASAGATSYKVKRLVDGSPYTEIGTPTTNTFVDTAVLNEKRYFYVVSAVNATGESANSLAVSAFPKFPSAPLDLKVTAVTTSSVSLAWQPSVFVSSYTVKRSTDPTGPFSPVASGITSTSFTDTGLSAGPTYYYVVSGVNNGGEGYDSLQTDSYANQDVGSVGIPGSASQVLGISVLDGSGAFIWSGADEFHFKFKQLSGNCSIIAKVVSVSNSDPWAQAGVMIRESLASNSKHAFMAVSAANGLNFVSRVSTGGPSAQTRATGLSAPYWVKLERSGTTLSGYRSTDGSTWTLVGSATISMATTVYVGMAVNAHDDTELCEAIFNEVATP